jgi:tetratricopeptide (TPR) repeat protein
MGNAGQQEVSAQTNNERQHIMNTANTPVTPPNLDSQEAKTSTTLETTVAELFDGPVPADLDPDAIALQAHTIFRFLPAPITVEVEGFRVTLQFPMASSRDHERARRLAHEAAALAGAGRCRRAIRRWKQALKLEPLLVPVWRDLGMAATELRRFAEARRHLTTALRLQRDDVGSLVALAKLEVAEHQDLVRAEAHVRRAVEQSPGDGWALNALGAVLLLTGRIEEGISYLEAAIHALPEAPNPYLTLAALRADQGRTDEALDLLDQLFRKTRPQDSRSEPVYATARQLLLFLQTAVAGRG